MKDDLNDIEVIKNKWYGDESTMWEKIKKYKRLILDMIGIICVVTGGVCFIIALYKIIFNNEVVNAAGLISLGIGLISLGIALLSHKIAKKSDEKMTDFANATFLRLIDRFENRRLELYKNRLAPYEMELTAWKSRTYLEEAITLKNLVNPEHQAKFINHFINLLNTFPWKGTSFYTIDKEIKIDKDIVALIDVKNLLLTYTSIRKLKVDGVTLSDKPMELIELHIGKRKKEESIDKYLERKNEEISLKIKEAKNPRYPFNKDEVGKKTKQRKKAENK